MRTIWWDMDGPIANLYAVENWLPKLHAEDASPYAEAEVLVNMSQLARLMNRVQMMGYKLGIISWTAKNSTESYADAVAEAKLNWLKLHLASVKFDEMNIVKYGVDKNQFCKSSDDILFDDEEQNRNGWTGKAYNVNNILEVLKAI